MNFNEFAASFEKTFLKSLPAILILELGIISMVANVYFISHKNDLLKVAGVGIGTILINVAVISVLSTMNMHMSSIMYRYYKN